MTNQPAATLLFAAGFGTRMRPLTETMPKPLVKVAGKTLLDHTLGLAEAGAQRPIVVNSHFHADQIARHLHMSDVKISHESGGILDTGGGLKAALPLLNADVVFTSNTDAVWRGPNPFDVLRQAWRPDEMDALLLCVARKNAAGHSGAGDFLIDTNGRLTRGAGAIYGGVQIIRTKAVRSIPEDVFSLNLCWTEIAARGRLFGVTYAGKWCDVGTPAGIPVAEQMLKGRDV